MLAELADAAEALCDLLEAEKGLRHPKHAATIEPARAKLTKMLVRRFRRQRGNLLDKAARWLPWLAQKYAEAEVDEQQRKATLTHTIKVNIDADGTLTGVSAADIAAFDAAVGAAAAGAMRTVSVDLAIRLAKDQAKTFTGKWLTTRGFRKLAADVDATTRENIANAVADTFLKAGSYDDAVQAIKDTFTSATDYRADMIARTELNAAYNSAMLDSAKEVGGLMKVWEPDGEACEEICQPNVEAGPVPLDDEFPSGDDAPPAHPNCLLAGTEILAFGISAAIRRRYKGEICVLRVAELPDLSVTPNHPVLCMRGWITASRLKPGDKVLQGINPSLAMRWMLIHPNDNHVEARVEDVVHSLAVAGRMMSIGVPPTTETFNTDSLPHKEVEIVWAAGRLSPINESTQNAGHQEFATGHRNLQFLATPSDGTAMVETLGHSSNSALSGRHLRSALLGGHSRRADQARSASASLFKPDGPPVATDSFPINADAFRQLQDALAGYVRVVELSEIEVREFDGHVYNLQTADGFYFANSILVHNCDCGISFQKPEEE